MAKTRQQKQETVTRLRQELPKAKLAVFANFAGLKAKDIEDLRNRARSQNMVYTVAKKTLMKRVCNESGIRDFDPKTLPGSVGMLLGFEDEIGAAKLLDSFRKDHDALKILGGLFDKGFIDALRVVALAKLPGKKELLGQLVGTLQAPITGFVSVLAGNIRGLVTVLQQIKDKKAV